MEPKTILLTTDFSDEARAAYPAAANLARKFKGSVLLVHVLEPLPPFLYLHEMGLTTDWPKEKYREECEELLRQEMSSDAFEGVQVVPHLLCHAHPYEAVHECFDDEDADLVVLSPHGHATVGSALLGSFAQRAIRYTKGPVLVYRRGKTEPDTFQPERVLVPFDFSQNARAALPTARMLARTYGSSLRFLHVVEPIPALLIEDPLEESTGISLVEAVDKSTQRARERFRHLQEEEELRDLRPTLEVRPGQPHKEIIRSALEVEADVILMTTHGWTGWRHFLIGSVAEKVVRKAPCSVWTVPVGR